MPTCPNDNCFRSDVVSNHISDGAFEKVAHATHACHGAHFRLLSAGGLGLLGIMTGVNKLRRAYRCRSCGTTFN